MADFLQGRPLTERAARHTLPEEEVSPGATLPLDGADATVNAVASKPPEAELAPAAETSLTEGSKSDGAVVEGTSGGSGTEQPGRSDPRAEGGSIGTGVRNEDGRESTVSVADVTPW